MAKSADPEDGKDRKKPRKSPARETVAFENYWLLMDDLEVHREELRHRAIELADAQSALEAVEDLLAEAPLGYLIVDANGTIRDSNATANRILGINRPGLAGWSVVTFGAPGDRKRFLDHYRMAKKSSEPVKTELSLKPHHGNLLTCQLVTRRYESHEGLLHFRTTILDLTDRRRVEEALQTTERRLSAAVEASGAGVFEFQIPFEGLLYLSHRLAEMLGYARTELPDPPSIPEWMELRLTPEDAELLQGVWRELAARTRESFEGDIRLRHRDRGLRWIRIWAKASPAGDGRIIDVVGAAMDVTAEKERSLEAERHARQLRSLASELYHVEERERRELATELHDNLAQLIVATKMKLGVLGSFRDESARRKHVESITELLDRANEMVRSLTVNLSPPILDELGLASAVSWLAKDMERQFGIEVHFEERGKVNVPDPRLRFMLFRSIRELLINAAKHSKARKAWVLLQPWDGGIEVVVEDHGEGFDLDRVRSEGSNSFGLFSIQERFRSSGGEMRVRTAPGQGTTIALRLSKGGALNSGGSSRGAAVSEGPMTNEAPRSRPRIRVLLADDHEMVRSSLARLLDAQSDLEVIGEASDGESAIELTKRLAPEVVLMDVTMSGLGGIEATRRLSEEYPESRVVGLSMHDTEEVAAAMRNAGAFDYLAKSSPTNRLLDVIRKAAVDARHARA